MYVFRFEHGHLEPWRYINVCIIIIIIIRIIIIIIIKAAVNGLPLFIR